jgi:NAD-dependent SIR2 family protein deacetylase
MKVSRNWKGSLQESDNKHGELTKVTSSISGTDPACIKELPLDVPMRIGDMAADDSQIRPNVVWFGEKVYYYEISRKIVREADIFLVIGTSLKVTPAAIRANRSILMIWCGFQGYPVFDAAKGTVGVNKA